MELKELKKLPIGTRLFVNGNCNMCYETINICHDHVLSYKRVVNICDFFEKQPCYLCGLKKFQTYEAVGELCLDADDKEFVDFEYREKKYITVAILREKLCDSEVYCLPEQVVEIIK